MARKPARGDNSFESDRLKSYIGRIETLMEERSIITEDIKEIFAEAKASGFDTKVMRALIKIRKVEPADFEEEITLLNMYLSACGMATIDLSALEGL